MRFNTHLNAPSENLFVESCLSLICSHAVGLEVDATKNKTSGPTGLMLKYV